MTERILTLLHALPRLLVPFVPLMMLCAVISALAALTLVVVHTNSEAYHLTPWTGEAILLDRGEDMPPAAGSATAVPSFPAGQASIGVGQSNATPADGGRAD
jgi:hypothetical protein